MTTMKALSAALKLIDMKKENLRKAFDDLRAHSSSLSSFTLTWPDLESYFNSLQSSLEEKFKLLQSLEPQLQPSKPSPKQQQHSSSVIVVKNSSESAPVPARPELKSFCEKMDGLGLRRYITERPGERAAIRAELLDAFQCAPDVTVMVLDAMKGFYRQNPNGDRDLELLYTRRSCLVLLEELMESKLDIGAEVRERAMQLAVEWKGNIGANGENPLEALGFLHLLATYGLVDGFNVDEVIDCIVVASKYNKAIDLCRVLNFEDKMSDLIPKLISKGKKIMAVRYIFEFEMTEKFPPVPLLKAHIKESKEIAQKVRKSGKHSRQSLNEATAKEISALKSVINCIEVYKLESEYSKDILVKRVENLEKEMANRKRPAAAPASKPQQQQPQKQSKSKRPRTTALGGPATIPKSVAASSTVPPLNLPHIQTAGLLPDHPVPYLSSPAGPYGLPGSNPAVAPYTGSTAGLYGFSGAPLGFPGNLNPTGSNPYPSESHMPSGYYDRPIASGGYALPPQYHPSYYPQ